MSDEAEVRWSNKAGLTSPQRWMVVRGKHVFLRLWGTSDARELVTATAGEDDGSYAVCPEQGRLRHAAAQAAVEFGSEPIEAQDQYGRLYIRLSKLNLTDQLPSTQVEVNTYLSGLCERFFELYDDDASSTSRIGQNENLYEVLATDDSGAPVYLGDGIWLNSDGSSADLGR